MRFEQREHPFDFAEINSRAFEFEDMTIRGILWRRRDSNEFWGIAVTRHDSNQPSEAWRVSGHECSGGSYFPFYLAYDLVVGRPANCPDPGVKENIRFAIAKWNSEPARL